MYASRCRRSTTLRAIHPKRFENIMDLYIKSKFVRFCGNFGIYMLHTSIDVLIKNFKARRDTPVELSNVRNISHLRVYIFIRQFTLFIALISYSVLFFYS